MLTGNGAGGGVRAVDKAPPHYICKHVSQITVNKEIYTPKIPSELAVAQFTFVMKHSLVHQLLAVGLGLSTSFYSIQVDIDFV